MQQLPSTFLDPPKLQPLSYYSQSCLRNSSRRSRTEAIGLALLDILTYAAVGSGELDTGPIISNNCLMQSIPWKKLHRHLTKRRERRSFNLLNVTRHWGVVEVLFRYSQSIPWMHLIKVTWETWFIRPWEFISILSVFVLQQDSSLCVSCFGHWVGTQQAFHAHLCTEGTIMMQPRIPSIQTAFQRTSGVELWKLGITLPPGGASRVSYKPL